MKRNYYKYLVSCVSGVALLFMQTHIANAADTNVNASAKPLKSCKIGTIDPMDFGEIYASSSPVHYSTSVLRITCSNSATYNIYPNNGKNGPEYNPDGAHLRYMSNIDGDKLVYVIETNQNNGWYQWKSKIQPDYTPDYLLSGTGSGDEQSYSLRGHIASSLINQLPASAYGTNFTDQVTVTLELAG